MKLDVLTCVVLSFLLFSYLNFSNAQKSSNDTFLENWITELLPIVGNQTVLDLSFPGSHDSMTWDLSNYVSDNANDIPPGLAWILHELGDFVDIGNFARNQSKTQGLNMTDQLNAGLRFIDFRIVYSSGPGETPSSGNIDWYCLHFMESNNLAVSYLQDAKDWLDSHPKEILTMWLSYHGNTCDVGYPPEITTEEKQMFWKNVTTLFDGYLFNTSQHSLNTTTINELIDSNQRLILFVSDYANFTNNSTLAIDGCMIDNQLSGDVSNVTNDYNLIKNTFINANVTKENDKKENKFFLYSMAGSAPQQQIEYAALMHYLQIPLLERRFKELCSDLFNIPNMSWCPNHLQDISQLTNYYNQVVLDEVITENLNFPNAIYIDAVDKNGNIRTGTQLFGDDYVNFNYDDDGEFPDSTHTTTGYAYSYTIILYNIIKNCDIYGPNQPEICTSLYNYVSSQRALNPVQHWDDKYGRNKNWPSY